MSPVFIGLDGRGAGDRADRRPVVRRQAPCRSRQPTAPGCVAGAARWRCSAVRCSCFRHRFSRCRVPPPKWPTRFAAISLALALSLPASLLFTVYRGFNTAVSRPQAVMVLQLGGLALKVPLSAALISGVPALGVPALGVTGCGLATLIAMWAQVLAALPVLRQRPLLRPLLRSRGHGLRAAAPRIAAGAAAPGRADGADDPDRGDRLRLHGHLHRAPGRRRRWPATRSPPTWCR